MVRSSRMRNFPAHIPASQSQTLPPQRREPASASATQIDILYLSFILSDFFWFYADSRGEEVEFPFSFSLLLAYPTFFLCVFPSGRSFSFQWRKKVGLRTNKVLWREYYLQWNGSVEIVAVTACRLDLFCPWKPGTTFAADNEQPIPMRIHRAECGEEHRRGQSEKMKGSLHK